MRSPTTIDLLLDKLLSLEISLGNIIPNNDNEKFQNHASHQLKDLEKKQGNEKPFETRMQHNSEEMANHLFQQICRALQKEGLTSSEIADRINAYLTGNQKLNYCDASEVDEALSGS